MANRRNHFFGRHYEEEHATGPFKLLNPTNRWHAADKTLASAASLDQDQDRQDQVSDDQQPGGSAAEQTKKQKQTQSPGVYYVWRSRDNRKGRHAIAVDPAYASEKGHSGASPTHTAKGALDGIVRMMVRYPVWDVSYDVAVVFTLGSAIWVINAFFSWLPLAAPSTEFSGETTWASGISALIGATVFELGSVLLMLEAINENRVECFGWAVEESVEGLLDVRPESRADCQHSHSSKRSFVAGSGSGGGGGSDSGDGGDGNATEYGEEEQQQQQQRPQGQGVEGRRWSWWPTWHELTTHYIREIGFLACSSQMFGATVFWISGFTALPSILNRLSLPAQNALYWLPQVVGGVGFIVSSFLFMVEVQPNWYTPAPKVLGWHIGLWNLIGAIGFTLCGALGFDAANSSVLYALTLSTFMGSWAFLIGSAIQWYESLSKYPIWVDETCTKLAEQK